MNERTASPSNAPAHALRQTLSSAWQRLAPRERVLVGAAAAVVGLALLWWLGLAPALHTLRQAPEQHRQLDTQLAQMRALATSADALRAQGKAQPLSRSATQTALQQASAALGAGAQINLQGGQATVTLRGVAPEALARWLEQVRVNARLLPVQAQLQNGAEGWSGTLVLAGPGLEAGA